MTARLAPLALLTLLASGVPGTAAAQRPVTWRALPESAAVQAGATFTVRLTAMISRGWHLYSTTQDSGGPIPTAIKLPPGQPFSVVGAITSPAPDSSFDAGLGITVETFDDSVTFGLPVRAAGTPPGPHTLHVHVRYQACTATVCLPPRTEKLAVRITVQGDRGRSP